MTLYLDSSAVVASYFYEAHTASIVQALSQADEQWISLIAYVETRAALAQLRHQKRLVGKSYYQALAQFEQDWKIFQYYEIDEDMVRLAGKLAERYMLKGYDAMHLASAIALKEAYTDLYFISYDARLNRAASNAGLVLWT